MLRTFNCRNKGKNAKGKGKKGKGRKESYDLIVNIDLQAWNLTSEQVDMALKNNLLTSWPYSYKDVVLLYHSRKTHLFIDMLMNNHGI